MMDIKLDRFVKGITNEHQVHPDIGQLKLFYAQKQFNFWLSFFSSKIESDE